MTIECRVRLLSTHPKPWSFRCPATPMSRALYPDLLLIAAAFVAVKTLHAVILFFTPLQFDVSSAILLAQYAHEKTWLTSPQGPGRFRQLVSQAGWSLLTRVVDRLVTWDAVYFADLFVNPIQFEHQFVFCPLWWRLIAALPALEYAQLYSRLLLATIAANVCHLAAAYVLYFYTLVVFTNARLFKPRRMALTSLILFVWSPAAAFLTAPYSEAPAALFSFLCLYLREVGVGPQVAVSRQQSAPRSALYILSGAFAAIAFGMRANCLFLGCAYLYDLWAGRCGRALPLAAGLILGVAFVGAQIHSYVAICLGTDRGEWCGSALPSLFAYAQAHYWNNGFLKYWTPNNIPNFIFGAPSILLLGLSIRYFAYLNPIKALVPVLIINGVFLSMLLLFWHVQIVTRVHTFLPTMYWLVAGMTTQPHALHKKWAEICVTYFFVWNVAQVALFGAFLPPA